MSTIRVENLKKIYNESKDNEVQALKDASFELQEGEFVVILGASGAGKSTLLNILGGMDNASYGSYIVDGEDVAKFNSKQLSKFRRTKIGFVFQFYNLMPNLTALENVQLAASVADEPFNAKDVLVDVGLEHRLSNFPSQLSGGQRQRVAIAMCLMLNPAIIIADEPLSSLDTTSGARILSILSSINREFNTSILLISHNLRIVKATTSRVLVMNEGKIVESGNTQDVLTNPQSDTTKELLDAEITLHKNFSTDRLAIE